MKRLAAVMLLVVAAHGQPVAAAPSPTCGGEWATGGRCTFTYTGGVLKVWGTFVAARPVAITVWIERRYPWILPFPPPAMPEPPDPVPLGAILATCAAGPGFSGGCAFELSALDPTLMPGRQLLCRVYGAGAAGTFGCGS